MEEYDVRRHDFLLNAAVAFGDACTRPKLTPTCPFYEESDAGPTCAEQCRGVAESLGDNSRKISHHQIGGLVLIGREIPRSAAAGAEDFDASRLYIAERQLPVRHQSTSALLLGLRHHSINIVLSETRPDEHGIPSQIWEELHLRDFPTARAAAAGLSLPLARAAASRATFGRLTESGLIGSAGAGAFAKSDPWVEFRLLADDPNRVFQASVPDRHLFLGLDRFPYSDHIGEWLWTRLTQTALDGWSQSALVQEWAWQAQDERHGISRRVLQERVIEPDVVSRACLKRLASNSPDTPNPGFNPGHFVKRAIGLLTKGDAEGAANIFSGLTELRPTDAEAWNNLGFCQIPFDPDAALQSFGKSAMFSREANPIRIVNQVLALHLRGRDYDALILASEIPEMPAARSSVWLWNHTSPKQAGRPEQQASIHQYLMDLVEHIESGRCGPDFNPQPANG